MPKPNDGGPAFPWANQIHGESGEGMSLRDWFAGQAMGLGMNEVYSVGSGGFETAAAFAYEFADAMLAAREKTNG